jgi:hypothetical protein
MDDSLLSDSIKIEDEQVLEYIDETSISDLNSRQMSEQVDDLATVSISNIDSPVPVTTKGKKNVFAKKKRPSKRN